MGAFDFLKRKELAEIATLREENSSLKNEIERLSPYKEIADIDKTKHDLKDEVDELKKKLTQYGEILDTDRVKQDLINNIDELKEKYANGLDTYKDLQKQIDICKETLDIADCGIYEPHFDFDTSDRFKAEIEIVREQQKSLVREKSATSGGEQLSLDGNLADGQALVRRQKKLMIRALNGECDVCISSVEWNNVVKMEQRMLKSFDFINSVFERIGVAINRSYLDLKIKELRLTYEYKAKVREEKEEQRRIREQIREEEKAKREYEAARIRAEKEEITYQKALKKAREDLENAGAVAERERLLERIRGLEQQLGEAADNKERAISMAQQTRRGHVYVISNIGSFGENVYKIGLTRRLDPLDRVKELGDASVPFTFDVHALIFSEDAPTLETTLHRIFDAKRVNMMNTRREFFHVTLAEIESVVKEHHGEIEFTKLAQAQEYRETCALRQREIDRQRETEKEKAATPSVDFPENLFKE